MPLTIPLTKPAAPCASCPLLALTEPRPRAGSAEGLTPDLLRARYDAKLARMLALSAATLPPLSPDDAFAGDDFE